MVLLAATVRLAWGRGGNRELLLQLRHPVEQAQCLGQEAAADLVQLQALADPVEQARGKPAIPAR